jgi:hypothetical protein
LVARAMANRDSFHAAPDDRWQVGQKKVGRSDGNCIF